MLDLFGQFWTILHLTEILSDFSHESCNTRGKLKLIFSPLQTREYAWLLYFRIKRFLIKISKIPMLFLSCWVGWLKNFHLGKWMLTLSYLNHKGRWLCNFSTTYYWCFSEEGKNFACLLNISIKMFTHSAWGQRIDLSSITQMVAEKRSAIIIAMFRPKGHEICDAYQ